MPESEHDITIRVTEAEAERLRAALRAAGLRADGSVEALVREALRARLAPVLGQRDDAGRVLAFEKKRGC